MNTTYFWGDPHLDHFGVLEMCNRPFITVEEHNDYLIEKCNETVGLSDRLFVMGDFAWRGEASFLARLRCKNVILIIGNHDRPSGVKKFKSAEDVTEIKLQGHKVFLSHYPHAFWPSSHHGALHLYGHTHYEHEATLDRAFPGRRSLDVGVDSAKVWLGDYRPFSEAEILTILLPRPGHDPLDWYKQRDIERKADREKWLAERAQRDTVPVLLTQCSVMPASYAQIGFEQLKALNEGRRPARRLHSEQKEFGGQTGPSDTGFRGICVVCGTRANCDCTENQ